MPFDLFAMGLIQCCRHRGSRAELGRMIPASVLRLQRGMRAGVLAAAVLVLAGFMACPPLAPGLSITVVARDSGDPILSATVSLEPGGLPPTAVLENLYYYTLLAEGTYAVSIAAEGFEPVQFEVTLQGVEQQSYVARLAPVGAGAGEIEETTEPVPDPVRFFQCRRSPRP